MKRKLSQMEGEPEKSEFSLLLSLAPEILVFLFGEFLNPKDLFSLALVGNRTLTNLTNDESVWKRLVERKEMRDFHPKDKKESTWKDYFSKIIDWRNFKHLVQWEAHSDKNTGCSIGAFVVLGEGLVASGGDDLTIKIWDLKKLQLLRTLKQKNIMNCLVEYKGLIVSFSKGWFTYWDPTTGEPVRSFKGHSSNVDKFCVIGDLLASGEEDYSIKLWNYETGNCVKTLMGHSEAIFQLIEVEGSLLSLAMNDDSYPPTEFKKWNLDDGSCEDFPEIDTSNWSVLCRSSLEKNKIYFGDFEGKIGLFNLSNGKIEKEWEAHKSEVFSLSEAKDNRLVSLDETYVKVWDPLRDFENIYSEKSPGIALRIFCSEDKIVLPDLHGNISLIGARE
jgi:WD40 repeat protein